MTWARALLLLLAACGGTQANPPGAPDAAPPTPPDAAVPPTCGDSSDLPAFAAADAAHALRATCADHVVAVEALDDGIVRLTYAPPGAVVARRPWSAVTPPTPAAPVAAGSADGAALLCAPELTVRVDDACAVTVTDRDGRVLSEDLGWDAGGGALALTRAAPAGEHYYGLGERTGGLDRRGRSLAFWNTDAYDPALGGYRPDQDPLYLSVPALMALRDGVAHGTLVDSTFRLEWDLAAADPGAQELRAFGAPHIDLYVVAGPALRDVVRRTTRLTGRTPLPPRWALGFHQSRWGYWPDAELEAVGAELRGRGIPADGLWLDIQHLDGYRTFTWDPVGFPDPDGLLARLGADSFHVTVIADPGIKVDPGWPVYDEGLAGDHFLVTPAGPVYQGVAWPGASAFPDFTRPETRAWWGAHVAGLVERGVAGIWLDVNEPTTFPEGGGGTTVPDDVLARGVDPPATMAEVHNVYAVLEATATFEAMRDAAPDRRPFVLSRAGTAGIQRVAAVWTGDAPSDWAGLANQLPMLLGLGLSGVPFVGSDVGGYSGNASPELYARWMALGSISPFFRAHVTSGVPGQEPWRFGVEVEDVSRAFILERSRLLPYLYGLFAEAQAEGAPILRPMAYEFQDDPRFVAVGDQAMLGPWLLVAPVVTPGAATRTVVLPAGRWFERHSGAVYEGPGVIDVGVTLAALPTFVRAGAVVPVGPTLLHEGAAPLDPLLLDVYPGAAPSQALLYEDAGDGYGDLARTLVTVAPTATGARITATRAEGSYQPPPRTILVRVRRVDQGATAVRLDGAPLAAGEGWWWDDRDLSVLVAFPGRAAFDLELDYDPAIADPRAPVTIAVEVELPAGTPWTTPITIATSANGWTHQPLTRIDDVTARGELQVLRGEWFFYKYARGDWLTVEKYADCSEAQNRYRFGAAATVAADRVAAWRDMCE